MAWESGTFSLPPPPSHTLPSPFSLSLARSLFCSLCFYASLSSFLSSLPAITFLILIISLCLSEFPPEESSIYS